MVSGSLHAPLQALAGGTAPFGVRLDWELELFSAYSGAVSFCHPSDAGCSCMYVCTCTDQGSPQASRHFSTSVAVEVQQRNKHDRQLHQHSKGDRCMDRSK